MIDRVPRWPGSNYPDFNKKKFDYSKASNIDAYLKTADRLEISITMFGADKISVQKGKELIGKIIKADTIHEMTVYADVLWDAYNSYDIIFDIIAKNLKEAEDKNNVEKLTLLIKYLKLDTGLNRRPIDGKHFNEINDDASFYRELAAKAKEMIKE